jgi:hypothetical protein
VPVAHIQRRASSDQVEHTVDLQSAHGDVERRRAIDVLLVDTDKAIRRRVDRAGVHAQE